ncbi:hypothetical protein BD311DRAFT_153950 [Dichomitus squalens]|uniref:Uncharacterized protein n=1 Tax=Dichomitus squalens TaxID=114155 RepID=A0A4Q9M5P4_9APHY|nr:hypothetical protein BD311DRAFT_153950 [Dichomitus squalens]
MPLLGSRWCLSICGERAATPHPLARGSPLWQRTAIAPILMPAWQPRRPLAAMLYRRILLQYGRSSRNSARNSLEEVGRHSTT